MMKDNGKDIRILFASNDNIALETLKELNPDAVLTTVDHSSGRKRKINVIKEWGENNNKKCYEVEHIYKEEREEIKKGNFDMLISFSFSKIFGEKFLSIFPLGAFNIHPSPLPKYRGPSPIQNAILDGIKNTSVVIQTISLKMDEGDIVLKHDIEIQNDDDYTTLSEKISKASSDLIKKFTSTYPNIKYSKQEGDATYTHLISKDAGIIDFNESGEIIERKIRAYKVYPRLKCYFNDKFLFLTKATFESSKDIKESGYVIENDKKRGLKIATNGGYLYVNKLQLEGKNEVDNNAFINGYPMIIGTVLKGKEKK